MIFGEQRHGERLVTDVAAFSALGGSLQKGVVEYDGKQLAVTGGFVAVQKNEVSVCVEINE